MNLNELIYQIRASIFSVHSTFGPGLLESVYESALLHELTLRNISATSQIGLPVVYKNITLGLGFRIDILVENLVIIEIKSIDQIHDVHKKQLLTYLKLSGLKLGLLVNFNVNKLIDKESLIRMIN